MGEVISLFPVEVLDRTQLIQRYLLAEFIASSAIREMKICQEILAVKEIS